MGTLRAAAISLAVCALLLGACAHGPRRLAGGARCSDPAACASGRCVLQRCIAEKPGRFGAPCREDWQCDSVRCKHDGKCGLGQLGQGEPCEHHDLCQSSVCDPDTGTCMDGPDNRGCLGL